MSGGTQVPTNSFASDPKLMAAFSWLLGVHRPAKPEGLERLNVRARLAWSTLW